MYVTGENYVNRTAIYASSNKTSVSAAAGNFSETVRKSSNAVTESAIATYKNRHPDQANLVDAQVRAGKSVIRNNGAENISREDMTMEEYKQFFTKLMDSIPFDASQHGNTEIWSITDEGWAQMKNDPDYEAWVLGYTSQNRSVRMPFGMGGSYCVEKFGASIEEHLGQSFPADTPGKKSDADDDEESWWEKRHKRISELIRKQAQIALEKDVFQSNAMQSRQIRMQMTGNDELNPPVQADIAVGIYESMIFMPH